MEVYGWGAGWGVGFEWDMWVGVGRGGRMLGGVLALEEVVVGGGVVSVGGWGWGVRGYCGCCGGGEEGQRYG